MPISSPNNELLKEVRKLAGRKWRDKLTRFVAEGEDLVDAAEAAGWVPVAKLVAADSGLEGEEVVPHLLADISTLGSGTRVIGVFDQRYATSLGDRCVALWGVGDPGNVGTVLRSAHAFGATLRRPRPGHRRPVLPEGGARLHGRDLHRRRPAREERRGAARPARGPGRARRGRAHRALRRRSSSVRSARASRRTSSRPATASPTSPSSATR